VIFLHYGHCKHMHQNWVRVLSWFCRVSKTQRYRSLSQAGNSNYLSISWMLIGVEVTSGLSTSIALETALLRWGKDKLGLNMAFKTAMGMSFISMLAMELAENIVDFHLTGGVIALQDPQFWGAAVVSIAAGCLVPLPWNYYRLRRWGKACH
jgi:hypothetical protein